MVKRDIISHADGVRALQKRSVKNEPSGRIESCLCAAVQTARQVAQTAKDLGRQHDPHGNQEQPQRPLGIEHRPGREQRGLGKILRSHEAGLYCDRETDHDQQQPECSADIGHDARQQVQPGGQSEAPREQ